MIKFKYLVSFAESDGDFDGYVAHRDLRIDRLVQVERRYKSIAPQEISNKIKCCTLSDYVMRNR